MSDPITRMDLERWRKMAEETAAGSGLWGFAELVACIALVEELAAGIIHATDDGGCMVYTERARAALQRARSLLGDAEGER